MCTAMIVPFKSHFGTRLSVPAIGRLQMEEDCSRLDLMEAEKEKKKRQREALRAEINVSRQCPPRSQPPTPRTDRLRERSLSKTTFPDLHFTSDLSSSSPVQPSSLSLCVILHRDPILTFQQYDKSAVYLVVNSYQSYRPGKAIWPDISCEDMVYVTMYRFKCMYRLKRNKIYKKNLNRLEISRIGGEICTKMYIYF